MAHSSGTHCHCLSAHCRPSPLPVPVGPNQLAHCQCSGTGKGPSGSGWPNLPAGQVPPHPSLMHGPAKMHTALARDEKGKGTGGQGGSGCWGPWFWLGARAGSVTPTVHCSASASDATWKTTGRLPAGGLSADSTPTGLGLPSPTPLPMHRQESIRRLLISAGQGGVVVTPSVVTPSTNNPHCFLR